MGGYASNRILTMICLLLPLAAQHPFLCICFGKRDGKEKSLKYIALEFLKNLHLLFRFYAFYKNGKPQLMARTHQSVENNSASACPHIVHQALVQFQPSIGYSFMS